MGQSYFENFINIIQESLEKEDFMKLTLSSYHGTEIDLVKILIRAVVIKSNLHLSFTYRYKTRDIVKNFLIPEALNNLKSYLKKDFKSATLFTGSYDISYPSLKKSPPTLKLSSDLRHDRTKVRAINPLGKKYLYDLKITDKNGDVLKSSQDKFRQIHKYIEIIDGLLKDFKKETILKIVDMGSGKGYLTFALYDYMQEKYNTTPQIMGVEYRKDLVDLCNKISKDSDFKNLSFIQGSIQDFDAYGANILIALHACDTATDDAIEKGIMAQADLIVVAPCCHKQIRKEIEKNKIISTVDFMTRHGIFMERHAEMVTDSLRAMILEYCGYDVKVFEFISGEHTAKNIMIVATKKSITQNNKDKILKDIEKIKANFGIGFHALEKVMKKI